LKHDFLSYLAVQKIYTYIAKQCSHVELPYFVTGFTLGPTAQATIGGIKVRGKQLTVSSGAQYVTLQIKIG